jgi:Ca-activated chloride channel family protein
MMDDFKEFDDLANMLRDNGPAPDPSARSANILAAMNIFEDSRQENPGEGRPIYQEARKTGFTEKGMNWMNRKLAYFAGGGLVATSFVALITLVSLDDSGTYTFISEDIVNPYDPSSQQKPETASVEIANPEFFGSQPSETLFSSDMTATESEDMPPAGQATALNMASPSPNSGLMAKNSIVASRSASDKSSIRMESPSQEMITTSLPEPSPVPDIQAPSVEGNDKFDGKDINPVKRASEDPVSTFSVDVDTASWSFARQKISIGQIPQPAEVRIEEMVNYFDYGYIAPQADAADPFATHVSVFDAPWNEGKKLVRIGIQGTEPALEDRPPLDLAFLIDTSGSMNQTMKLGLLKKSLMLMLPQLRPEDRVGIVAYAGSAGIVLEMTAATERSDIVDALSRLQAGGSTAGAAGLRAAYGMIGKAKEEGRIGRVILATDGDFNVGISSNEEMKSFIEARRDEGAYLSVLGFGQGNYNDALMQTLAQNGNGQAAYIDTLSEARKVLVDQLSGALFPIANDVKIQVEFNPEFVQEYRLIGYETRALAREDFNNDKIDAGEIGAGHQVTALYEVTLTGSDALEISPLRYDDVVDDTAPEASSELGYVNLRYKKPGETKSILIGTPIIAGDGNADTDAGFAAAIAGFGQLLKDDKYMGGWTYSDAADLAISTKGEDPYGYRAEAIRMIKLMDALAR